MPCRPGPRRYCAWMDERAETTKNNQASRRRDANGGATGNIVLLLGFLAVVGIGVWLVNALLDARKADECMTQRRRDCTPITTPTP